MGDSKVARYPDNEMSAAILPLKDQAADGFLLGDVSSSGWDVARCVALSAVAGNRRFWQRDKEGGFRPKFAPFYQEQINYRNFTAEPGGGGEDTPTPGSGESETDVPTPPGGGPPAGDPTPTGGGAHGDVGGQGPSGIPGGSTPDLDSFLPPGVVIPGGGFGIPGGSGCAPSPGVIGPGNTINVGIPGGSGTGPGVIGPGNNVNVGIPGGGTSPGVIGGNNTVIAGISKQKGIGAIGESGALGQLGKGGIRASFGLSSPSQTCGSGGRGSWRLPSYDVGFEMSIVSDLFGKIRNTPGWQPSNLHSENRSGLVLSRMKLEDADKGDIDLPPRYFGRTHDFFSALPTQKVKLSRIRYKGGTPHLKKTESTEQYEDGVFKTALNMTPIDKPISGFDQKTEEDGGPGDHGFALHDYIPGYPDPKVSEPDVLHQGSWMFDARQKFVGSLHDIFGIDGIENGSASLPRWKARHDWNVGIGYIRHDAHFQKEADDD